MLNFLKELKIQKEIETYFSQLFIFFSFNNHVIY